MNAIHNIERCRDECRTSLLIAVVVVPAIFHTLLPPCHPYITIHFMEMIFPLVPLIFDTRQSLLYHAYKYQPCFYGTGLHLTETSQ